MVSTGGSGRSAAFRPERGGGAPVENGGRMFRHLAAFAALFIFLCRPAVSAEEVVRLGNLKFAHYGAVSYMKEVAPKYGVKIEETFFARGADITSALKSGEVDVAASGSESAILARASGAPIYAVAGFASGAARIVARKDAGVNGVAGLKGRKVAVTRGSVQEVLLMAELNKHGLTWSEKPGKDVRLVYLGFNEMNKALASGSVDAICQSEPQSSMAILRGFGVEVTKPYDTPIGVPVRLFVMTETLYRDKPELAATVVQILVDATKAFLHDKALAERYVREQMFRGSLSAEEYAAAMENASFTTDVDISQIDATTALMVEYGLGKIRLASSGSDRIANPPKAADWVRLDLLERAKALAGVD